MPKRRYAAEKDSDISLLPALVLLILVLFLYVFDVRVIDFVVSAVQPANPLN